MSASSVTGAAFVVHLGTGAVLDVRDGVRLVEWDSLSDADREKFDSGIDSDAWDVGYRCGRVFDLLDTVQASEWYYGHDCEAI
mgnify:CR=1 FL=1